MPFYYYLEEKMLRHILLLDAYIPQIPYYLTLSDISSLELTGQPGYARIQLDMHGTWEDVVNGMTSSKVELVFPEATGDWTEKVAFWGIVDSEGNILIRDAFQPPFVVKEGDMLRFKQGVLKVRLGSGQYRIPSYVPPSFGPGGHALSDYMKDKMLKHILYLEDYATPAAVWVGLLTADPGDGLTNANCNELPWGVGGYFRELTSVDDWVVGGHDMLYKYDAWNTTAFTFADVLNDWGTITHFALFDIGAPQFEGHALLYGSINPSRDIAIGSKPRFDITVATGYFTLETLGIHFSFV